MKLKLLLHLLIISSMAAAQSCFTMYFNNCCSYQQKIIKTKDGGYAVAGTSSIGGWHGWVLKLDGAGNIKWQKKYAGGTGEYFNSIAQTHNGGYVVAGFGYGIKNNITAEVWVLSLDSLGNVLWEKSYGGAGADYGYSVIQAKDSSFVVAGSSNSFTSVYRRFWIMKMDTLGTVKWQKTYGGTEGNYEPAEILQHEDGGYVVAGKGGWNGSFDMWMIKLDASGNLVWQKAIGGTDADLAAALVHTSDKGYLLAGNTFSFGAGDYDVFVVKTDSVGKVKWKKAYGGTYREKAYAAIETNDGNYLVAGQSQASASAGDYEWLVKLDTSGNILWEKKFGSGFGEAAFSVVQASNSDYVVTGNGATGYWIFGIDSAGNGLSCPTAANPSVTAVPARDTVTFALTTAPTATVVSSTATVTATTYSTTAVCPCPATAIQHGLEEHHFHISPNPFSLKTTLYSDLPFKNLDLVIYNSYGQKVREEGNISGRVVTISRDGLPEGIYFLRLVHDGRTETKRVVVMD